MKHAFPLRFVYRWLLLGCVLIALMVVVGGITRLTGSGLSITEWDVIGGSVPPLSDAAWQELFARYRATPQYVLENSHFGLAEFKRIFWWEWIHRFLGRAIGVVFLLPFLFLVLMRRVGGRLTRRLLLLLALGAAQGLMGWLMVASGLVDNPRVSHFRLAAHLLLAFLTFVVTLWTALDVRAGRFGGPTPSPAGGPPPGGAAYLALLLVLVTLQVTWGAFVAGLRAGFIFNTFPTMGGELVPTAILAGAGIADSLTSQPVGVQFVHRWLGALVALGCLGFWWRWRDHPTLGTPATWIGAVALLQFILGALTMLRLPSAPVFWGTVHQFGALALVTAVVVGLWEARAG